jgi:sarcosine oxidase subunit alpha
VRVDGIPNRRACTTSVREGMHVEPQNRVLSGGPDPTALVDRMFASNLDHHHFMVRPKLVNRVMQEVARNLAGLGTLPDRPAAPARWEEHRPDVVVIGGGRSGRAAASRLRAAGLDVACLERHEHDTGVAAEHALAHAVFGIYPNEGRVAAMDTGGVGDVLRTYRPSHVLLATGAREVMTPVRNNDLPGVLAARGLAELLARTGDVLACPTVVIGPPTIADPLAATLGAVALLPDDVRAILGGGRVEAIATTSGKREVGCVALASPAAPASELARQAGAKVQWNGDGFAVVRDGDGRCGDGPWTLWACGEVAGTSAADAADDGERVATAIVAAHRAGRALR